LYDIGREGEIDYLVMEYLEGRTLEAGLDDGALALPEALDIAIQIAGALESAHAAGIIHRDLKPANIMLTKSGAKLLDFGLAKPHRSVASLGGALSPLTSSGMLVGTVQYMSPEQIQDRDADTRSDIFAFGTTLYEMLTGRRAFAGESSLQVANAILEKEPPPPGDPQPMPPALDRLVRKCLAKNAEQRWQSTSDLASALRWIAATAQTPAQMTTPSAARSARRRELLYQALALILLFATILSTLGYWRIARAPQRKFAAEMTPPAGEYGGEPSVSPDGRYVAFRGVDESGTIKLWIQSLDSITARVLPGTEGASHPFWSADSRALGFFTDQQLKTVDAAGGSPVALTSVTPTPWADGGGTWNGQGTILFVPDTMNGLYKIAASGGKPVPVFQGGCPRIQPI